MTDNAILSPIRRALMENVPIYYPFGERESINVLEGFKPVSPTNILFLGCGEVRHALHTISCSSTTDSLNVHLNDINESIIARTVFIVHAIKQSHFDPDDPEDVQFIWDVSYNLEWSEVTLRKFNKAVEQLVGMDLNEDLNISGCSQEKLKGIWIGWTRTAASMTRSKIEEIKAKRLKASIAFFSSRMKRSMPSLPLHNSGQVYECLMKETLLNIGASNICQKWKQMISSELELYFQTGSCEMNQKDKICINPSLLEPGTEECRVHYMANPYKGYLPLPTKLPFSAPNAILKYCQQVLKNLLIRYKQNEKCVVFHFHVGDALQLCYRQPKQFHVIDTGTLGDFLGLANVLNAARCALINDPTSILLTESVTWETLAPSMLEYVETALCSPLQLFPAIYGVRLLNPLHLGYSKPFSLDRLAVRTALLKWQITFHNEDTEINICVGTKETLASLRHRCFFLSETDESEMKTYTPLTYCYVLGSLIQRYFLSDSDVELLLSAELWPRFSLSWRALTYWMTGRPVLHVKATIPGTLVSQELKKSKLHGTPFLGLVLVPNIDALRNKMKWMHILQRRPPAHTGFDDVVHYIDNMEFQPNVNGEGEIESLNVSFLLPQNHGLETTCQVFLVDTSAKAPVCCLGSLQDLFCFQISQDRHPFDISNRRQISRTADASLFVNHCSEYANAYMMSFPIVDSKVLSGVKILIDDADQTANCHTSHRITFSAKSPDTLQTLVLTLPWPILKFVSGLTHNRDSKTVVLIRKLINEPWPSDFDVFTKWAAESMEIWDDRQSEHLGTHVHILQFQFSVSGIATRTEHGLVPVSENCLTRNYTESNPLNELRQTICSLFDESTMRGRTLFTICSKSDTDTESCEWILKVHLPVRVSPEGSPLLRVTAVDLSRTKSLIDLGVIDKNQAKKDLVKIYQAGKNVVKLTTKTSEEDDLLRSMLRLNSTRMTPNSWETKNLSKHETGSWMPTFVSPLYMDNPQRRDNLKGDFLTPPPTNSSQSDDDDLCSQCRSKCAQMKRCARCKKVMYCSVECQRADWPKHKMQCSKSN